MESVTQMQRAASSHCSLLRHTELFYEFLLPMYFCHRSYFTFFFLIQFNTCFIFHKNLFLLLSFGEPGPPGPCHWLNMLTRYSSGPAGAQSAACTVPAVEKIHQIVPLWPTASDTDETETGLQREQPAKYVVNCSVRGEAAIKQRWQSEGWNRVGCLRESQRLFFFFLQSRL